MPDKLEPISLAICLLHHPASELGSLLRPMVYRHYRRDPHRNLGEGGLGLEVEYRSDPASPGTTPIPVDFTRAQATAVVAIMDEAVAADAEFGAYVSGVAAQARPLFPACSVLAVAVDDAGHRLAQAGPTGVWQVVDARSWSREDFARTLFTALDRNFCGLLAAFLAARRSPGTSPAALRRMFARKAQVFLSHSKHDSDRRGTEIAQGLRAAIEGMGADAYFDAVDVPSGTPWEDMLDDAASSHALVIILTDSYSSRTWCRKEVLAAKRAGMPIVIASCLQDYEVRGFPYAGNVPVIQMVPHPEARRPQLIGRLFDEVLRSLVWKCHVGESTAERVLFLPRAPELVSLAYIELTLKDDGSPKDLVVVYPGAPLGAEEEELFGVVASHVRLVPFVAWKVGVA